jgi:lipopolysaccharide export system permease protein
VILDRYLAKVVLGASGITLLALVGLSALFTFIGEVDDFGKGHYGAGQAALYILMLLPRLIYEFIPTAVLIGAMMGLGTLASANELTAMQAGGMSIPRLSRSVIQVGLLIMLVSFVMGEFIAPEATREGIAMRAEARSAGISLGKRTSFWARDGDRFIYVGAVVPDRRLERVRVYEFEGDRLLRSVRADAAELVEGGWVLEGVRETRMEAEDVQVRSAARERWERLVDPALVTVLEVQPEVMSAQELYRYVDYLRDNNLDAQRYALAFWIKVVAPLVPLAMLVLSLPFVFGSLRSAGAGQRLLVGILIGIGFYVVNRAMNHAGLVFDLPPALAATAPLALFLIAGLVMLRRTGLR